MQDLDYKRWKLSKECKLVNENMIKNVKNLFNNESYHNYLNLLYARFKKYTYNLCYNIQFYVKKVNKAFKQNTKNTKYINYLSNKKYDMKITNHFLKMIIRLYQRHAYKLQNSNKVFNNFVEKLLSCNNEYCKIYNIINCNKDHNEIIKFNNILVDLYQNKEATQLILKYNGIKSFFDSLDVDYKEVSNYLELY